MFSLTSISLAILAFIYLLGESKTSRAKVAKEADEARSKKDLDDTF